MYSSFLIRSHLYYVSNDNTIQNKNSVTLIMAGRSEVERIEKHNTCFFPLALFLLVGGFDSFQSYGFSELAPNGSYNDSCLCHFLPESDSTANSTLSKGNFVS